MRKITQTLGEIKFDHIWIESCPIDDVLVLLPTTNMVLLMVMVTMVLHVILV